jgi:hypothetical protein
MVTSPGAEEAWVHSTRHGGVPPSVAATSQATARGWSPLESLSWPKRRTTSAGWTLDGDVKNVNNLTALTSMSIRSPVLGASRTVSYNPPRHVGVGYSYDF